MTIGFGMLSPVLNEPRNEWYQKRNHVRIPKRGESKKYLDAAYTGGGGNVPLYDPDVLFDSLQKITDLVEPSPFLTPASVSFVDASGSGGKKFMRVVVSSDATYQHGVIQWKDFQFPQEGIYRALCRCSGVVPATTQTHGPCILGRFTLDGAGQDRGYTLGHFRYGSTDRRKVRRIIDGVTLAISGLDTDPPFVSGDWFWQVFRMRDDEQSGYYYKEGDADPASWNLCALDQTYDESHGNCGFSFQGNNALLIDIAEFHYEPLPSDVYVFPTGYPYMCQIDTDGTFYGCNRDAGSGTIYGRLEPFTISGLDVAYFAHTTGSATGRLALNAGAQFPGVTAINISFNGGPQNVTYTWNSGSSRYQTVNNATLLTYFNTRVARTVQFATNLKAHSFTIANMSPFYGYSDPDWSDVGVLSPNTIAGAEIGELLFNTSSNFLRINPKSGAQIPGVSTITVAVGGISIPCPWSAGNNRYQSASGLTAAGAFFTANVGVPLTLYSTWT